MSIFAILKDGKVENTVVFEESRLDELAVIFPAPTYQAVLVNEETAPSGISIGDTFVNGTFRREAPFKSWIFNEVTLGWEAPVKYPQDGTPYVWDEDSLSWVSAAN